MQDENHNQVPCPKEFGPLGKNSTMISSRNGRPWSDVAIFENPGDGELLEMELKNKGFETRTYNDKLLQLFLFLCPPHHTFRVQVRAKDIKNAACLLDHGPAAAALLQKAIRCPSCGSLRVQYPQMTRKFLLPTLILHVGIIFRAIAHQAYCESCHWLWSLPRKSVPDVAEPRAASAASIH